MMYHHQHVLSFIVSHLPYTKQNQSLPTAVERDFEKLCQLFGLSHADKTALLTSPRRFETAQHMVYMYYVL